jgi:hypothetical protein
VPRFDQYYPNRHLDSGDPKGYITRSSQAKRLNWSLEASDGTDVAS